jgi:inner membrane transporter RhtA
MQSLASDPTGSQSIFPSNLASLETSLARGVKQLQRLGGAIPPSSLILLSSFAIQIGTVVAKSLFDSLGSVGAAFVCKAFAAILLLCLWRPRLRHHSYSDYALIGLLGLTIAGMSLTIYGAIERIPLGIASTLEFVGPLMVAVIGSRRLLDLVWVTLATTGVLLLAPLGSSSLDWVGVVLALLSAGFWASYILVSGPAGRAFPGGAGLALAMVVAALLLLPAGVAQGGVALLNPMVFGVGFGAAFLGTAVPYSLEYAALKKMPPRMFGVLISIEPAIAALVGFIFLKEQLEWRTLLAIVLVTSAAIGVTLFGKRD